MQRLADHSLSKHVEPFIMKYRKSLIKIKENMQLPKVCIIITYYYYYLYICIYMFLPLNKNDFILLQPEYDSDNRPFVLIESKYKINYQYQSCFIIFLKLKKFTIGIL